MTVSTQSGEPAPKASFREFFKLESTGGLLLFVAAVLAMLLKNSPWSGWYADVLTLPIQFRAGDLNLDKPLVLWVNDGLMAIFFLLVTLEIKREILIGHLSKPSDLILPGVAAVGGMALPAAIFVLFNWGNADDLHGWAIPTTTDIAFSLGVLALFGTRVPLPLKIFLMTLAVLDDLGAIIVIALFYTDNLSWVSLMFALLVSVGLLTLNRLGVHRFAPYFWLGAILWVSVLKSGVHATLAGVIVACAIPLGNADDENASPLKQLIHILHPWVAFAILPLFAFLNAGIDFEDFNPSRMFTAVPIGIALGLLIGKPLGVMACVWLLVRFRLAILRESITMQQLWGVAFLCGIGFTMSLFLGALAFQEGGAGYTRADRLGIILGSLASGVVGYLILRRALPRTASAEAPVPKPQEGDSGSG
ncbi:MAG: Na+/H+ antiporter NhaA [Gammaproteobacteria bacterium]|nr:Na+/H+ antiporter NhaA [Gammaproteobacteria bacterium]